MHLQNERKLIVKLLLSYIIANFILQVALHAYSCHGCKLSTQKQATEYNKQGTKSWHGLVILCKQWAIFIFYKELH